MPIKTLTSQEATLLTHPYKWEASGWSPLPLEATSVSNAVGWGIQQTNTAAPMEVLVYNASTHPCLVTVKNAPGIGSPVDYTGNAWAAILPRETAHIVVEPGFVIGIFGENASLADINLRYYNCSGQAII